MNFVVLFLFCFAVSGNDWPLEMPIYVSGHSLQPKIKGGQDAQRYQFPHQASLQIENRHVCGGALVSEDSVLTTCGCVQMLKAKEGSRVVLGALDLDQDETDAQVRNISNYIEHFGCGMAYRFDIGILRLDKPVTVTKAVRPIKVDDCGDCEITGVNVTLSGWGSIFGNMYLSQLQWVHLKAFFHKECASRLQIRFDEYFMCTFGFEEDFQGMGKRDEGTPLLRNSNGALMALALYAPHWQGIAADSEIPTVYLNICHFQKWIKDMLGVQ